MRYITILGIMGLLVLAACSPQQVITTQDPTSIVTDDPVIIELGSYEEQDPIDPKVEVEELSFKSEEELLEFLSSSSSGGDDYYGGVMMRGDVMEEAVAVDMATPSMAVDSGAGKMVANDYSGTNNQVANVDEGDILKTDGEYIYTVSGEKLYVIKAYPGENAKIDASMDFDIGRPTGMFINGDKLVVFGYVEDYDWFSDVSTNNQMSFVQVYDVSDKKSPELVKEFTVEGSYVDSRMIDEYAYIIVRSQPDIYHGPITPFFFEGNVMKSVAISDVSRFNIPYDYAQFVSIFALDIDHLEVDSHTLTVESSQEVYMSENNLYLSYTKYINEWEMERKVMNELVIPKLSDHDKELVRKIKSTDNEILSYYEKQNKINNIVYRYMNYLSEDERDQLQDEIDAELKSRLEAYDYREYTIINKVAVDGLDITPVANTMIPGGINNQFSMDEYNNVLRVATTVSAQWSRFDNERTESSNHIFTLDDELSMLGHMDDIANDERIYSTRFMGDKLYMVTFRQVDPFFVFDLSNPQKIKALGELKIPGFSRYLHPYDENTIIGIGRDASETGRTQGLKISLFDVSDVNNPVEIAKFVTSDRYSHSTAEYEHKAFLFSKEKNLLVIPAYSYGYGDDGEYNGAMVFDISKDDISLRGLIDHSSGVQYRWSAGVERSLYIEDLLYTKSYGLLRINELDDLSSVKSIKLANNDLVEGMPVV